VRQQISGDLADTLTTVQQLSAAVSQNASEQSQVQGRVQASQSRIDSLKRQIERLDKDIATTQRRIDDERTDVRVLARGLYEEPAPLLVRLLRAGSVRDVVTETGDMTAATLRADALKRRLTDDLARLQQDLAERKQALDDEGQTISQLSSALSQLHELSQREQKVTADLQAAIQDGQSALSSAGSQSPSLARSAAALLQQRQQQLIATAEQLVWEQERLWAILEGSEVPAAPATRAAVREDSAVARAASGSRFIWPMRSFWLTQGFGPSSLWLEPAMFGYAHFHAGLDLASGDTTVAAAADGIVSVVGLGSTGYGNNVVITHNDGFVTLYGHLAVTMVRVGQRVAQGQQIGVEGTTGASTGVHLHFEARLNGTPVDPTPYLPPPPASS
jgi:murein DD-endopeptidase MepM/ murein hydrolase activator NlpD